MVPSRPVVLPHGIADVLDHQDLLGVAVACGGDPTRLIDARCDDLDAFARYLKHVAELCSAMSPLVLLTKTSPLSLNVIALRRTLERLDPRLRSAAWVVFWEPYTDPLFESEARAVGEMEAPVEESPIWTTPGGLRYLLVVRGHARYLESRVSALLAARARDPSRRVADAAYESRDTPM